MANHRITYETALPTPVQIASQLSEGIAACKTSVNQDASLIGQICVDTLDAVSERRGKIEGYTPKGTGIPKSFGPLLGNVTYIARYAQCGHYKLSDEKVETRMLHLATKAFMKEIKKADKKMHAIDCKIKRQYVKAADCPSKYDHYTQKVDALRLQKEGWQAYRAAFNMGTVPLWPIESSV